MFRVFARTSRDIVHGHPLRPFFSTARRFADPWPLPNTPEHFDAATTTGADHSTPTPLARPNEGIDTMRARLLYQSRKRGTLETDLLLSTFAKDHLSAMGETELIEYDKVLLLNQAKPIFFSLDVFMTHHSCSTNRTGTSTIGQLGKKYHQNDGQVHFC
jgi:succinate dehydrogenase flavin-adding protein (antitoxin of CptAB toxin-antitoxin module)